MINLVDGAALKDADLDDDQLEAQREQEIAAEEARIEKLNTLGAGWAQKRKDAIEGRRRSGIEQQWDEDEEFYEGIDDANRGEHGWSDKPPRSEEVQTDATGSTIFLNITGHYCDAGAASLARILQAGWSLGPTPVPELIPFAQGMIPKSVSQSVRDETAQVHPEFNPDQQEAFAAETEGKLVEKAKTMLDEAKDKAEAAQKRIEDWMTECHYTAEAKMVIADVAKVGSGVMKGPFPQKRRQVAYKEGQLIIQEEIKPGSKRIHYRNLYPDPACGENPHNGAFIFERDEITAKQLRELIGVPGYLEEQIRAVLEEGPQELHKEQSTQNSSENRDTKTLFEIWYGFGEVTREEMEAAGCECEHDVVPAQITMVNERVIKGSLNPLDTGEYPYDIMVWQKRESSPWGTGIARLVRTPQRMINGAARNLMDNAGMAGGPMWAYVQGILEPLDGVYELAPRKGWKAAEDASVDDVQKAFAYFKLDMAVNELTSIIQLALRLAEDVTGLPMIMQGQLGNQKVDTLGQTEILNNNAHVMLQRVADLYDSLITEPQIRKYYSYLLQYGDDAEKGEFVINAKGASNQVERSLQKEKTLQWLQMAQNPVYGIDPKKVAKELLRADKFDPKAFEFDDEEWQQIVQNLSQPQQNDPRAEIANINAQIAQMRVQSTERIEQARLQAQASEQDKEHQFEATMEQARQMFEAQLAEFEREGADKSLLDQLKVRINETVMKLTTQKELSLQNGIAKQTSSPLAEPHGQAPAGRAYER